MMLYEEKSWFKNNGPVLSITILNDKYLDEKYVLGKLGNILSFYNSSTQ